jgi:hypothetical protein
MPNRPAIYTISTARILAATAESMLIGSSKLGWVNAVSSGGVFLLLGLYMIVQGGSSMVMGVLGISLAVVMLYVFPINASLSFDFRTCQVSFLARYLIHLPMQVEGQWTFSQVAKVERQRAVFGQQRVSVWMADGNRFALDFGKKPEVDQFMQRMESLQGAAALTEPVPPQVEG